MASWSGNLIKAWRSPDVPASIRRPWQVFGDDLDCKKADIQTMTKSDQQAFLRRLEEVREQGTRTLFMSLDDSEKQTYLEISLLELSAYVTWQRETEEERMDKSDLSPQAAWDAMSAEEHSEWIPDTSPRDALTGSSSSSALQWKSLVDASTLPQAQEASSACNALHKLFRAAGRKQEEGHAEGGSKRTAAEDQASLAERKSTQSSDPQEEASTALAERARDGRTEDEWTCTICKSSTASKGNDLLCCDGCKQCFHQRCHSPPIADVAALPEVWKCCQCIAGSEAAWPSIHAGDFAWARTKAMTKFWPARVVSVDCTSAKNATPFYVHFFGSFAGKGVWLAHAYIRPWPSYAPEGNDDPSLEKALQSARAVGAPDVSEPLREDVGSEDGSASSRSGRSDGVIAPETPPKVAQKQSSPVEQKPPAGARSSLRSQRKRGQLPDHVIQGLSSATGKRVRRLVTPPSSAAASSKQTKKGRQTSRQTATTPQAHATTRRVVMRRPAAASGRSSGKAAPRQSGPTAAATARDTAAGGDWVCSVCNSSAASKANDIICCDSCRRCFHQRCHLPAIADVRNLPKEWKCSQCNAIASATLRLQAGDFAWARIQVHGRLWPARVVSVGSSSGANTTPFYVHVFGPNKGLWLGHSEVRPWFGHTPPGNADAAFSKALEAAYAVGAPAVGSLLMKMLQAEDSAQSPHSDQAALPRQQVTPEAVHRTSDDEPKSSSSRKRPVPDYIAQGLQMATGKRTRRMTTPPPGVASKVVPRAVRSGNRGTSHEKQSSTPEPQIIDSEDATDVATKDALTPLSHQAAEVREMIHDLSECQMRLQEILATHCTESK
mmetsp:Transcript_12410/g.29214  ORF Transcript_12410/g.29214 Transcript_12410/m.29214 type:complete len:835 (-) Transcript_12410:254-2758(-)